MPGITGLFGAGDRIECVSLVRRMANAICHDRSATPKVQDFPGIDLCIGWVGDNADDRTPVAGWNAANDVFLVFEGEIDGARPRDVVSLLRRHEERADFLPGLNGWFHGLLVDLRSREAVLFNDRFGLRRLSFHATDGALYFSSETKALLAVLPQLRELDRRSVGEFLSCGVPLQDRTLLNGVSLLPGGARWTLHPGRGVVRGRYFDPSTWEQQSPLDVEDFQSAFQETFDRILPRYLQDGQGIGMSLTGGLDGRMIMAAAPRGGDTLPCYTFGGAYRESVDVALARRVAHCRGKTHQVIGVGNEFLARFPDLAHDTVWVSDGAMDVSGAVELYVNEQARSIAPIRLTGNYGSEVIRRNVAFKPWPFPSDSLDAECTRAVFDAAATYRQEARAHSLSFILFKQVPWHHYARHAVERSRIAIRSPYLDNEFVSLMYRAPQQAWNSPRQALRYVAVKDRHLAEIPTDKGLMLYPRPVLSRLAASWKELTAKAEYAYDYGMPQSLASVDRLLSSIRPERLFLGRHKFYHFRIWYRRELSQFVCETLLDPRALGRPYVESAGLRQIVERHVTGRGNHTLEIHRLLTLELFNRLFLDPA